MERALVLETTFLVDLERERRRGQAGPARAFLASHEDYSLYVTDVIAAELAIGVSLSNRHAWERFIAPFQILRPTPDMDWHFARTATYLARNRMMIGANDLWIAAAALTYDVAVVTRNVDHFSRVPDLRVVGY